VCPRMFWEWSVKVWNPCVTARGQDLALFDVAGGTRRAQKRDRTLKDATLDYKINYIYNVCGYPLSKLSMTRGAWLAVKGEIARVYGEHVCPNRIVKCLRLSRHGSRGAAMPVSTVLPERTPYTITRGGKAVIFPACLCHF
jgi:hypothetical protein